MEETTITASITTDSDSPWFSGHFPHNPILPGIAQLKMVADLLAQPGDAGLSMSGLSRVKFRKLVRPGEKLDIQVTCIIPQDQYTFRITSGDDEVCSGKMLFTQNKTIAHP